MTNNAEFEKQSNQMKTIASKAVDTPQSSLAMCTTYIDSQHARGYLRLQASCAILITSARKGLTGISGHFFLPNHL